MDDTTWVGVLTITRPHGVRGELRAILDDPSWEWPESLKVARLCPQRGDGSPRLVQVQRVRMVPGGALLCLDGVSDRDAAQALVGARLEVAVDHLPSVGADDAYAFELTGARVLDEAGELVGTVARVLSNRGQMLLELEWAGEERLLPLVPETFVSFARESRTLVVKVVPGLWE